MYDRISVLARIGVWECDLDTGELSWTDTVYDLFELPRQSRLERAEICMLYEPSCLAEMNRLRAEAIACGTGFVLDIKIRTALGNPRWIRLTADVEQEAGRSVRIFGTKQDITAERAAQDKVQSLQNEVIYASRLTAMGTMGATLAHELNQPLTAASNYLAAARRIASRDSVDAELSHCIDEALGSILRGGEIIRHTRAMIGRRHSVRAETELEPVVKEAIALAGIGCPDIVITADVAATSSVRADRIQLQQVLINLIRNACEAAAGKPCRIEIRSSRVGSEIEICVTDNGPGIPEGVLADIFGSFVTTKPEGLGIGLSISRTIVEAHGGSIRAANLPEGGASICFKLPV
jgi:two-component system sensor kinase FixL